MYCKRESMGEAQRCDAGQMSVAVLATSSRFSLGKPRPTAVGLSSP